MAGKHKHNTKMKEYTALGETKKQVNLIKVLLAYNFLSAVKAKQISCQRL